MTLLNSSKEQVGWHGMKWKMNYVKLVLNTKIVFSKWKFIGIGVEMWNRSQFNVVYWRRMEKKIWVNIGSGNGLLPGGTKSLPEPMLTFQCVSVAFFWKQFHNECQTTVLLKNMKIILWRPLSHFSRTNDLNGKLYTFGDILCNISVDNFVSNCNRKIECQYHEGWRFGSRVAISSAAHYVA